MEYVLINHSSIMSQHAGVRHRGLISPVVVFGEGGGPLQPGRVMPGSPFLVCCCCVASVVSNSVRPYGQQPSRLLCLQNSPGENTGVSCHFLFPLTWLPFYFHWKLLISKYLSYFFTYDSEYFSLSHTLFSPAYIKCSQMFYSYNFLFINIFLAHLILSFNLPWYFLTLATFSM